MLWKKCWDKLFVGCLHDLTSSSFWLFVDTDVQMPHKIFDNLMMKEGFCLWTERNNSSHGSTLCCEKAVETKCAVSTFILTSSRSFCAVDTVDMFRCPIIVDLMKQDIVYGLTKRNLPMIVLCCYVTLRTDFIIKWTVFWKPKYWHWMLSLNLLTIVMDCHPEIFIT